jgi:hypothetical protein
MAEASELADHLVKGSFSEGTDVPSAGGAKARPSFGGVASPAVDLYAGYDDIYGESEPAPPPMGGVVKRRPSIDLKNVKELGVVTEITPREPGGGDKGE